MNALDITLLILCAFGFYKGFKNGILIEITTLIALVLGFYGAQHFASFTAFFLKDTLDWHPQNMYLISIIFTFILIVVGVYMLGKVLTQVASMVLLGGINKILGGVFGGIKVIVLLSMLIAYGEEYFNLLVWIPLETLEGSYGITPLKNLGTFLSQEIFISENLTKLKALEL